MPAPSVIARAAHRPAPAVDRLRDALLARVQLANASLWASQDAELEAEMATLDAVDSVVPTVEELAGLAPDPYAGPPGGAWGWLADLPGPLLEEYLDATQDRRYRRHQGRSTCQVPDRACRVPAADCAGEAGARHRGQVSAASAASTTAGPAEIVTPR